VDQPAIRTSQHLLRVTAVTDISASIRRVTMRAPTLAVLPLRPAQDVGLVLVDAAGRPVRKRYTLRNVDPVAGTVDLDGILHGHGPGARWFATATVGTVVEAVGPRGKIELADCDWHLFVGDESGLPAFAELAATLPAGSVARAIVEVTAADDEIELAATSTTWVHRGDHAPGTPQLLVAAIAAAQLPTGRGQAYLLGESRSVVVLRAALGQRGLIGAQVFLKGYWNGGPGRANATG
jgi:NADPH-dependent ferric siderophore reductase